MTMTMTQEDSIHKCTVHSNDRGSISASVIDSERLGQKPIGVMHGSLTGEANIAL